MRAQLGDPGLLILPTHRLIGGLESWNMEAFWRAIAQQFVITETPLRPDYVDELAEVLTKHPAHTFGLYDGTTKKLYTLERDAAGSAAA